MRTRSRTRERAHRRAHRCARLYASPVPYRAGRACPIPSPSETSNAVRSTADNKD